MSRDPRRAPAFRCLVLWSVLTAVWGADLLVARGELTRFHDELAGRAVGPAFAPALAGLSAVILAVVVSWLWCVMTAAALEALRGVHRVDVPGVRGAVRRLVLAGCGVALAASIAPAHADTVRGVAGQPPQPLASPVQTAGDEPGTLVVEPRDSLWSIAAGRLGVEASTAEIDHAWRALWRANEAVVGGDPDHIEPGQRLTVPEARR